LRLGSADTHVVMGRVIGAYGVRGWVKITPLSGDPAALLGHRSWWLRRPAEESWRAARMLQARMQGATLVAELEGVATREEAAAQRGTEVAVERSALPAAGPDEVYVGDLVGLAVVNRQGVALGTVKLVQDYGAHPVLHLAAGAGAKDRLVPFVPAYVDRVDLEARRIEVDWPEEY
jgi:16S rRNA processing protein RimM